MQFLYQVFRTRIPFIEHRCHNGHLVAETFESECTLRSPNVVCRTCGEPVFVNAYIEWIEMTPAMRRDVWIGVAMATPFLGGALGVLLGAAALLAAVLLDAPDPVLLPLFWSGLALGFAWPTLRALRAIQASRARTALLFVPRRAEQMPDYVAPQDPEDPLHAPDSSDILAP